MRRSMDEIKAEIENRRVEYENRRKARMKGLGIGAGAALLLLATIPVIKASLDAGADAKPAQSAFADETGKPQVDNNAASGAQNGGSANIKPPKDGDSTLDGTVTGGMPENSEPTEAPCAPAIPGSTCGGTYGAVEITADGYYDPSSNMLDWYDDMQGRYRSFPRNGIEPQWAMIVVSDENGNYRHEVWNSGDAAKLLSLFLELHDSARFFETIDTFDAENPRTAKRHLPAGRLSRKSVIAFLVLNGILFVTFAWMLQPLRPCPMIPTRIVFMSVVSG